MRSPRRISISQLLRFAAAFTLLGAASVAIRILPFRTLVRTMGRTPALEADGGEWAVDHTIIALRRAAHRAPWRTACFDQGLAAHWMMRLQGFPSILHYGIDPADEELSAHVWVSVGGRILIGEEEANRHAEVASFPVRRGGQTE